MSEIAVVSSRHLHRLFLWVLAFGLTPPILAGVDGPPEEEIARPVPTGDYDRMVMPLYRVQNLFLLEATIDGQTGYFVLDTGAPGLVLNRTYFRESKRQETASAFGATGEGSEVYVQWADSLRIRDLIYRNVRADVVNLGHLENARGVRILGLLGANLFYELELELDLAREVLVVYATDKRGNSSRPPEPDSDSLAMPITVDSDLWFLTGNCDKKKLRFCLDTGAEIGVLDNRVGNKVLNHFRLTRNSTLRGSGNRTVQTLGGRLDLLSFAEQDFNGMPFLLTDLSPLAAAYGTGLDGILGYDFLIQGRVVINPRKKTLLLYFYES